MLVPDTIRRDRRDAIARACRSLMLSSAMVGLCETDATPKQEEFLLSALLAELESRERSRKTRLLARARFPVVKSFSGYEFQSVRFPPSISKEELLCCSFLETKTNLVLYGPVGTGKTHMAIALGIACCEAGWKVRFFTVTELVLRLSEARKSGTFERLLSELSGLDLLILDEWGYVPVDKDGSQLLFRVVADSYEAKSLILTTNLEFSKWGGIFTDEQMAAAMIDRLVHHGHLLMFDGKSYRMTHALMRKTTSDTLSEKGR